MMNTRTRTLLSVALLGLFAAAAVAEIKSIEVVNSSFEQGVADNGVPVGWSPYGSIARPQSISVVEGGHDGGNAVRIDDRLPEVEIGITQTVPVEPDLWYRVTVWVKAIEGLENAGTHMQLRFLPAHKFYQVSLATRQVGEWVEISVTGQAPPDTTRATIYLYMHKEPAPKGLVIDNVTLQSGVEPPPQPPPPAPPAPKPIPPVHDTLKELHLQTSLVSNGQPACSIVTPASGIHSPAAHRIQETLARLTGVEVPIVTDDAPEAAVPFGGNLIILGNRSTNRTLSALYDKFFTLLDLKYPGPGGHVVRTLHNPFGDGNNAVLVGGSDPAGVDAAVEVLCEKLKGVGAARGNASVGWMAEIKLGEGIEVPTQLSDYKIWEESVTYGSSGYFGWNMISKYMAMYYMTGDERCIDEMLRLSFPDDAAVKEIEAVDGERIENKLDPLAGPYHYSAHMMVLFWDLIEESPLFTDEQRLKITNAFSRQLTHRAVEGVYGMTAPGASVGNRHGDWAAMSLFCLARYFDTHYPDPIWETALQSCDLYFDAIGKSAWLAGYNDHLFWYTSYYDPLLDYMCMTGDMGGLETGNLLKALRTQDVLFTGALPDWGVRASSLNFLLRAAYLTGDGRFLYYLDRTGIDTDLFRLGQSYWPDESLRPRKPAELADTWTIQDMPEPMWRGRGSGMPLETAFLWGSYRNSLDETGDYMLIKGHNGGGRNPYHTFVVLEQRLNGNTLLKGYHTQVLTSADGMVEPVVAMDAQLLHSDVLGQSVVAIGEVPRLPYCTWRRTVLQQPGRYALYVDDLGFRADSENMKVVTEWDTAGGAWNPAENLIRMKGKSEAALPAGWLRFKSLDADCACGPGKPEDLLSRLTSIDITLLKATEPGTWIEMPFTLKEPVAGEVYVDLLNYVDRGIVRFSLDGEVVGEAFDHYAPAVQKAAASLGRHELAAGDHRLRVEVVDKRAESAKPMVGLMGLSIRPDGAPAEAVGSIYELRPSMVLDGRGGGTVTTTWLGPSTAGEHRVFFSLLAAAGADEAAKPSCLQVADNVAALRTPSPAVAVVGSHDATTAELAVISSKHIYGHNLTSGGLGDTLVRASAPVDIDFDIAAGEAHIVCAAETELSLAVEPGPVQVDGKQAQMQARAQMAAIALPPGRHQLTGLHLRENLADAFDTRVETLLASGRQEREQQMARRAADGAEQLPELSPVFSAQLGAAPVHSELIPGDDGARLAFAEGNTIHILAGDGSETGTLTTDGKIRTLRWWEEFGLLLAGCEDEKLIAFDRDGKRKWVFVSEMAHEVWEAGKQYWFKEVYPGVYGLHTGVFDEGKSRCFVGGACTLEVVDEAGQLVKRMPVFWGPGWKFRLIDGPEDSVNLLIARWPNGTDNLAVINSRDWRETRSFYGVPEGHTMVGGWTALNRTEIVYDDLDGNGNKELVSAINGVFNRVTVFSATGTPLYNAQFGPGVTTPYANLRDMAVADLDGDGKKEILVAPAESLLVALTNTCERLWSARLPAPPSQIETVTVDGQVRIVVGCDDGSVQVLDGLGVPLRSGALAGRPVDLRVIETAAGPVAVFATQKGTVSGLALSP